MCSFEKQISNAQKENEKLRMANENIFKRNHCLQESHFKLFEQLRLRRKIATNGVISFGQTLLENENTVLKEKVEKL